MQVKQFDAFSMARSFPLSIPRSTMVGRRGSNRRSCALPCTRESFPIHSRAIVVVSKSSADWIISFSNESSWVNEAFSETSEAATLLKRSQAITIISAVTLVLTLALTKLSTMFAIKCKDKAESTPSSARVIKSMTSKSDTNGIRRHHLNHELTRATISPQWGRNGRCL